VLHLLTRLRQGARQCLRARTVALQQMKGHALRRFDAHTRQAPQGLDQGV
jgi:hypothetical protein